MTHRHELSRRSAGAANWFFLGFLAIAGYFLLTEHRAHVVPYLPFLLLLACPLMHIFMHGGHGHHGGHEHGEGGDGKTAGHGGGCCGGGHEHGEARETQDAAHAQAKPGEEGKPQRDRSV